MRHWTEEASTTRIQQKSESANTGRNLPKTICSSFPPISNSDAESARGWGGGGREGVVVDRPQCRMALNTASGRALAGSPGMASQDGCLQCLAALTQHLEFLVSKREDELGLDTSVLL